MKHLFQVFLFCSISVFGQASSIDSLLQTLLDVYYEKTIDEDGNSNYTLKVRQPLDHSDTTQGFFLQKVYLSHKNFESPTVIATAGYNVNRNSTYEITKLLDANQLIVEHRFYGESLPDSMNYDYLNLYQAIQDLHHIRTLFSDIYPNKWISTGLSKGGTTTLFYKFFFPEDIDASISYVAPVTNAYEDLRIYNFLDTVDSKKCRKKILDFQRLVLKNREQIIPLLSQYSNRLGAKYSYLTIDEAFEYAVMEYSFSFWQWGNDCDDIPYKKASLLDITNHFLSVSNITFFSDKSIEHYSSHYYQAATEMGYYGYQTSKFKKDLKYISTTSNPMALFFPFEMNAPFNKELVSELADWLDKDGNQIIHIYGNKDTWSACAVPISSQVDAEWFMLEGKNHGNARISDMTSSEKERLVLVLEKWLNLKINEDY